MPQWHKKQPLRQRAGPRLRRNTLQTDRFPVAELVPIEARGLPSPLPESGEIAFQLVGDLTIRDVTQQVVWDMTARIAGEEVVGQAQTSLTFDDFNLTPPRVPLVLSVEDNIRLEMDLHLRRERES
ncbi:MAG: YceI family protein [Anaerolineae bacterium]